MNKLPRPLLLILPFGAAIALRLWLMPPERMPFASDEAIFLLMARHILAGERPLFFYGEAYGGSLDTYLIALGYALTGPSIITARLVQSLEYLTGMGFTYLLARRLLPGSRFGPAALLWLMAIPPLLMTTWTTPAVLYAIVICLGSVISYLGYRLLHEDADRLGPWLLFGAICGLAFWTFGILAVYMAPLFLLFLWRFRWRRWPLYTGGAVAFFLFSLPWWSQALSGLAVVTQSDMVVPPFLIRLFAFLAIGLPAFFGLSEPWQPGLIWPVIGAPVLIFYLAALLGYLPYFRRDPEKREVRGDSPQGFPKIWDAPAPPTEPVGFAMLGLQGIVWAGLYFGTRFSADPTGRYMLPLYPLLFIGAALLLERLARQWRSLAVGVLAGLLLFNLAVHVRAIREVPPGITAQMNPALWFGNAYDPALIEFVAAQGGRGYSHHWISYKIAFLSDESVILLARLPFRPDLYWNPRDDRYPPYAAAVARSDRPVYVTHREPNLAAYLQAAFALRDISYRVEDIGPYRVYYDLSRPIAPAEIGLGPGQ